MTTTAATVPPALLATLRTVAARVRYHDAAVFEWDGKAYEAADVPIPQDAHLPPAAREVARRIYDEHYVLPDAGRGGFYHLDDDAGRRRFMIELDEANATEYGWRTGWRVVRLDGARALIVSAKSGEERWATFDQMRGERRAGAEVHVRLRKGSGRIQPPWYHVHGALDHNADEGATVRVYWNVCASGAVPLVATLTRSLNDVGIPYHFKIVTETDRFTRADSAVLYMPREAWPLARAPIAEIHAHVARWMKARVPLFTKPLGRGLAAADSPARDSFGLHRSRLVAEGLWDAHEAGLDEDDDARLAAIAARFEATGRDLARPYLEPGSTDRFELDAAPTRAIPLLHR